MEKELDKGEWFDEKYKDILNHLRMMPKSTQEEKKQRYEWVRKHPKYDVFVIELMNTWRPEYYNKLKDRLQNQKYIDSEDGIASFKYPKMKDPLILVEVIKRTIEDYTGVNKQGNTYTFLQSVGQRYKQQAFKEGAKNELEKAFSTQINENRICMVLRLYREVEKLSGQSSTVKQRLENLEKCILKQEGTKFTKKEIQFLEYMIRNGENCLENFMLDTPISQEDNETETFKVQLKDPNPFCSEIEKEDEKKVMLEMFSSENWEKIWKIIEASRGKQAREFLKVFLSRNILIALKLEYLSEAMQKEYQELLEPKCKTWCPKGNCVYDKEGMSSKRHSCYIRYGERPEVKEMGDRELYQSLTQIGTLFYETVLDNVYVKKAYIENVENYDDLFSKKLKPAKSICEEDSFQFTDAVLGNAIGKSKSSVSKAKDEYERYKKSELQQIYKYLSENAL